MKDYIFDKHLNKTNLNKPYLTFFLILLLQASICFAQSSKPDIMLGIGSSYNIINQSGIGFQTGAYGLNIGFFTLKPLHKKLSVLFGFDYNYKWMDNYNNQVYYVSNSTNVNLNTGIHQQFVETPFIFKYNHHNFSFGAGAIFSYLFASKLNQQVTGDYNSTYTSRVLYFEYTIENNHYTSMFSRINVAPSLNIGYRYNKKITIEYFCSYDLISNPQLQYQFNTYNLLSNNLLLTFKIN